MGQLWVNFGTRPCYNFTHNKIWKTRPRDRGKSDVVVLRGERREKTDSCEKGADVLRRGAWSGRAGIRCRAWVGFPASAMSTLSLPPPGLVSRCSPPCNRQDGVHPRNRSWRRPPCQNHSDFTTHGTCEHDTIARWWIILSRPGPSEMNVLAPHYLILLSRSLYSWLVWISPDSQNNILSLMNPEDQSFIHLQCLAFDDVWPTQGRFTMCAFDRGIHHLRAAREGNWRSKILGAGCMRKSSWM